MAFLTAQQIATLSLEILKRRLVLPMTASRINPGQLVGPNGGTIGVRVRQPRTANEQTTPGADVSAQFTAIDEVDVPVTLAHLFDGTSLSDEELALEIEDFASQVAEPLVSSVAVGAEDQMAGALNALTADGTIQFALTADPADTKAQILAARQRLTEDDVPLGNRFCAVAPSIASRVLSIPELVEADKRGDNTALTEAQIGKAYGFTFLESSGITSDTCHFYHRSGVVWANRAPAEAQGAESATVGDQGIQLRVVRDFNPNTLSEIAVVQTLAGASVVFEDSPTNADLDRVIKVDVSAT